MKFTYKATVAFIALTMMSINPDSLYLSAQQPSAQIQKTVSGIYGIDTHNHVDVPLDSAHIPGPKVNLRQDLIQSGLTAICMTFAVDYQKLRYPGEAYSRFLNGVTAMDTMLQNNQLRRALNANDLIKAHKKHEPIVIQSVEGGHFLEGKIDRMQVAYDRGLRLLTLLHDNDASVPLGDIYTNQPKYGGLTSFGVQVVKECERLGILMDLTHCDNNTIDMILKIATKPVIVSHTGLDTQLGANAGFANMMKPRLISAVEARKIAAAGGLVGVWGHLSESPAEYAKNIKAMVDVVGVDHVCIGTDSKLTTPYRAPFEQMKSGADQPNDRMNKPDGGPRRDENKGPRPPQGERVGERTSKMWKDQQSGFMYTLVEALQKEGFSQKDIEKITGTNFLRVFDVATRK